MRTPPRVSVRAGLAIAQFGKAVHPPVDVELTVEEDDSRPVLEIHFCADTAWRMELSPDAGAYIAGALAKAAGVTWSVG